MKKFYYLAAGIATILVAIIACEKSEIGVDEIQTLLKEEALLSKGTSDLLSKDASDKVTICHYDKDLDAYFPITISRSALEKHLIKHGDKYPFMPVGDFTFHYKLGNVNYPHIFEFNTVDGIYFEVIGYYPTRENPQYAYPMEVNFNEDGTFEIHTIEAGHDTWTINGTWDKCEGIVSLEYPWSTTEWAIVE